MQERYKIIDSRTRETLADSIPASNHTQAETLARLMFPKQHVTASLLPATVDKPEPKKRTKKK